MSDSLSTQRILGGPSTPIKDAPEQLGRLWQQGQQPEVDAFLARLGPLSPAQVTAVLRVDQRERWQKGDRVKAERYLQKYSGVRANADHALELIVNEF